MLFSNPKSAIKESVLIKTDPEITLKEQNGMRGECLAALRLTSLVSRSDQNARESPLCLQLQILTIMTMLPLLLNHEPADFGQPRAHVIAIGHASQKFEVRVGRERKITRPIK
eukprot:scaffold10205_cov52-Cyclotella_meneghiniana.AAC.13